ncbi:chemotaxis protein CheY [Sinorhizobium meliloti]|uniref:response regulator n=1 Tax=Rhizobium meliloti TaxID=382 RepID=UPI0006147AE8|nr:response regulator [Sinorhizobium meliloti]KKA12706.1 chemotaxis protein CheY [Sinorhizobium meliloti]
MTERRLRVLVVEDESMIAMLIEDTLCELGHEVAATASRMQEALDIARKGQFDIAIIDVNLDGEPSYPVADILAARNVPFIFATGYGSKGLDTRYSNIPLLTKPFLDSELEAVLVQISKEV